MIIGECCTLGSSYRVDFYGAQCMFMSPSYEGRTDDATTSGYHQTIDAAFDINGGTVYQGVTDPTSPLSHGYNDDQVICPSTMQFGGGTTYMHLHGTNKGEDTYNVTGKLTITGGTLTVEAGTTEPPSMNFDLFYFGSYVGDFGTINYTGYPPIGWSHTFDSVNGKMYVTSGHF